MKSKKAELTSKQLITIIILIVSFSIIIAFFVMLNLKKEIDRETCRNSVVMRGIFSKIPFIKDYFINLKCKTEKICFSMNGKCGEKTDRTINVQGADELARGIINLKKDCSWMFGEEKINYAGKGDCAVCYRIYFDDKITNEILKVPLEEAITTSKDYAIITGNEGGSYFSPKTIEFSADELKKQCSNFLTEI
jgi:hypothetical protein